MLFLLCCVVLTAFVLGPEIFGNGKSKDYALWFWAGQQVLHGGDLYPSDPHDYFSFSIRRFRRFCSPFRAGSAKSSFILVCHC